MIYVTGSSGFIGKHLLSVLKDEICCVPHEKISSLEFAPFEQFYFLSSYGNLFNQEDDAKIWQANVVDLISVLEKVSRLNFQSFVFVSTSSVKLQHQTMYSRAKKAAEEVLLSYIEKYHLPISIVRPYSVTGVGEQAQHLIPTIIRSCYTGELVNFVPKAVHDWIDVDDVVAAMVNLSQKGAHGVFEVGNGKKYSNQQVLEIVERVTKKKVKINVVDRLRDYDNADWFSTNFRSRMYGWLPKKSLEQSISEMVHAYE